jgi:glycerol kinase
VRWIDLPVVAAQHFLLETTSVSVLSFEHGHADRHAIALWNSYSQSLVPYASKSSSKRGARIGTSLKREAIERWENEGGEPLAGGS